MSYVEIAVHDARELAEGGGIDEEGWDEVDLAGRFGVLSVLSLPAAGDIAAVAEVASLACEGGDERLAVDRELIWAARKVERQLADLVGVTGGLAREGADDDANSSGLADSTR